jgi:hypothetical protein
MRERARCIGCGRLSPETETNYTLISSQFGWRLTRFRRDDGEFIVEWRCPACWKHFKDSRRGDDPRAASSSRPPPLAPSTPTSARPPPGAAPAPPLPRPPSRPPANRQVIRTPGPTPFAQTPPAPVAPAPAPGPLPPPMVPRKPR